MVAVVAESMVGGTLSFHRKVIRVKFPESCSSLLSGKFSGASHRLGKLCLDNAFVLIEGHLSGHPPSAAYVHRAVWAALTAPYAATSAAVSSISFTSLSLSRSSPARNTGHSPGARCAPQLLPRSRQDFVS